MWSIFICCSATEASRKASYLKDTLRVGDGGRWPPASATNALRLFHDRRLSATANEASCTPLLLAHLCGWVTAQFCCLRCCWMNSARELFNLELCVQTVKEFLHVDTGMCTLPPQQPHVKNLCNNETMVWQSVLRGFVILQCCWGEDTPVPCPCIHLPVPRPEKNPEHSCGESQPVLFSLSVFCHLRGCQMQANAPCHSRD